MCTAPATTGTMRSMCCAEALTLYHSVLGRCHTLGANHPIVAACEGLCEALAEGAAYGALRKQWAVYSLCAEVDEVVLQVYLQRKNSIGSGTRAAGFGGKSGDFGRPKKVLDKRPPW